MEDTVPWAGRGYPEDDKFTALFDEAVRAFLEINDLGTSQYCAGLIHAYALVTGEAYHVVWNQVCGGGQGAGSLVALASVPCRQTEVQVGACGGQTAARDRS